MLNLQLALVSGVDRLDGGIFECRRCVVDLRNGTACVVQDSLAPLSITVVAVSIFMYSECVAFTLSDSSATTGLGGGGRSILP